jgi:monoamine oxidase
MIGAAGGSTAVWQVVTALGLMPSPAAADWEPLAPESGTGKTVAILGAGMSGLVAAWELRKAGYNCIVLEASHRVGGRNFTVRSGDVIDELGNRQVCQFDPDPNLYFNAGPARIPAQHQRVIGYCRELGVELEHFVNDSRNTWVQDDNLHGGRPVRNRELMADARGFVAELLSKSITKEQLDQRFDNVDAEQLLTFLRKLGDLDSNNFYRGSSRAGFARGGIMAYGEMKGVFDFSDLLQGTFWQFPMAWGEYEQQAAPVLQMVGGNDGIVKALEERVGDSIQINAQVSSIQLRENSVDVEYIHNGENHHVEADFCLNNIPAQLVPGIRNNFPPEYLAEFSRRPRGRLFKLAMQTRERFWEKELIYGGITWTGQDISQIWYPPHGINSGKGVILGAYVFLRDRAKRFERMTHDERMEAAIVQGEKIHPGYRGYIENGVSVAWSRMNHMLGCTAHTQDINDGAGLELLRNPVGRHCMMGDQTTYHSGWQEGAIGSAHYAINQLIDPTRNIDNDAVL